VELSPISKDRLKEWREKYRVRLGIPVIPDFYEALCQMGHPYLIEDVGDTLGYMILAKETLLPGLAPMIPEFFLDLKQTKYARRLLKEILRKLQPATIIGRTDDTYGFPLLMDLRVPNYVAFSLYVLEHQPQWVENEYLVIEESFFEDAQALLPIYSSVAPEDGGIPDKIALAKSLALWRHYRLLAAGNIQAVCYVVPQIQQYVTASPIVLESARNQGYGRYLMAYVIKRELAEGKIFLAVINPENEAARGLLESLGACLTVHFINFRP